MLNDELSLLLRRDSHSDPRPTRQCPDDGELAAFLDGALAPEEARRLRAHSADCDHCLAKLGFVARLQDDAAADVQAGELDVPAGLLSRVRSLPDDERTVIGPQFRRAAAAAAGLVLVVLSLAQWRQVGGTAEPPRELRDAAGQLATPAIAWPEEGAEIPRAQLQLRELSWTATPGAIFYEVRLVTADGERLWDGRVEAERARIPDDVALMAGEELFVWVRAYLPGGKTLQSGIVGFRIGHGLPLD